MILLLLFLYTLLELYEIRWQTSDTMMGMLRKMYASYRRSIWLFLIKQPTFVFAVFLVMITNMSGASIALLFIKTLDIATKILMIQQVFEKKTLSPEMSQMLLSPLKPWMPYLNLAVYVPLVYLALFSLL